VSPSPPSPLREREEVSDQSAIYQFAEKLNFLRLIKNAQMQGARNPEE